MVGISASSGCVAVHTYSNLWVVLSVDDEGSDEGAKYLGEYVVRHFLPWKFFEDSEGNGHRRIEMSTRRSRAYAQREDNAKAICGSDLE